MKSLLWIVLFGLVATGLLQVLDESLPIGGALSWSWLLYLIGGVTIFVVYTIRLKSKGPSAIKNDRARDQSVPEVSGEAELEKIRQRIRRRKTDLRSKK